MTDPHHFADSAEEEEMWNIIKDVPFRVAVTDLRTPEHADYLKEKKAGGTLMFHLVVQDQPCCGDYNLDNNPEVINQILRRAQEVSP
jgi:hypothetical protein